MSLFFNNFLNRRNWVAKNLIYPIEDSTLECSLNGRYISYGARVNNTAVILSSSDYGNTFNNVFSVALGAFAGSAKITNTAISETGQYQLIGINKNLYRSNDYGNTWNIIGPTAPSGTVSSGLTAGKTYNFFYTSVSADNNFQNIGAIARSADSAWPSPRAWTAFSTNGGSTFTTSDPQLYISTLTSITQYLTYSSIEKITVSPFDGSIVCYSNQYDSNPIGSGKLFRYSGFQADYMAFPVADDYINSVKISGNGSVICYSSLSSNINISTNSGNSFTSKQIGLNSSNIDISYNGNYIICSSGSSIATSNNTGNTFDIYNANLNSGAICCNDTAQRVTLIPFNSANSVFLNDNYGN